MTQLRNMSLIKLKEMWDGTFIEMSTLLKSQREMEETEGDLKCKNGRL